MSIILGSYLLSPAWNTIHFAQKMYFSLQSRDLVQTVAPMSSISKSPSAVKWGFVTLGGMVVIVVLALIIKYPFKRLWSLGKSQNRNTSSEFSLAQNTTINLEPSSLNSSSTHPIQPAPLTHPGLQGCPAKPSAAYTRPHKKVSFVSTPKNQYISLLKSATLKDSAPFNHYQLWDFLMLQFNVLLKLHFLNRLF
jgi:hypothetical protein